MPQENSTILGQRIKELRLARGWSLNQAALALGCRVNRLTAYENRNESPRLDQLIHFASVFQVSLDCLCGLESPEPRIAKIMQRGTHADKQLQILNIFNKNGAFELWVI